jgi:RNA polymerase sigma-70 factor, ECF subfamily
MGNFNIQEENKHVLRYQKGDAQAFEPLVKEFLPLVYSYAARMTGDTESAEDIAQVTFVKVWKNIGKYNPNASFRTWILTITHRTILDWFRKKKHVPFSDFDIERGGNVLLDTTEDTLPLPDEVFAQQELRGHIEELLATLPPKAREVLVLYFEAEMTLEEIAVALGESLNTVKSRYRRALLALRVNAGRIEV